MKKTNSPFLFSGKGGRTPKKSSSLAFKRMRRAKRKAAGKSKSCEFC